jgi:peptidoglycan/LPS O-acetylase OafA/YrhL
LLIQPSDKRADTLRGVVYTLFYVANWAQMPPRPPGIGPLSHAWSLSVEEQFYIVWPLLLLLLLKLKSKLFILAILSSLVTISLLLNAWNWYEDAPYLRMYFGSDTRANELLIGCITALLMSWGFLRPASRLKWLFHLAALASMIAILSSFFLVHYRDAFLYTGGFALVATGTSIVIVDILLFPSGISHSFMFAPLVWIGRISYGLYLWHFPIFETARRLFDGRVNAIIYQVMALGVTFLVATISYYFLELPFLKLRRRFAADEPISSLQSGTSAAA